MAPAPQRRPLRVGIDLDGPLANFDHAFRRVLAQTTGRAIRSFAVTPQSRIPFFPDLGATTRPDVDARTLGAAFEALDADHTFWSRLSPAPGAIKCMQQLIALQAAGRVEPYLLAARRSPTAYQQTRVWVDQLGGPSLPVLMVRGTSGRFRVAKGLAAAALGLDWVVDDQYLVLRTVVEHSPGTRTVLVSDGPQDTRGTRGGERDYQLTARISNVEDLVAVLTGAQ